MSPRSEGNGAGVPRTTTTKRTTRSTPTTLEVTTSGATVVLTPADLDKLTPDQLRPSTSTASAARRATRSTANTRARAGASTGGAAASTTAPRARAGAHSEEVKAQALEVLERDGLAAAHRATGVSKPTLSRWAKAAGVDVAEGTRERTAAATAGRVEQAERVRLTTVQLLERHIDQAGHYLHELTSVNASAAEVIATVDPDELEVQSSMVGPVVVPSAGTALDAWKRAKALDSLPLSPRDAEGILTRAVHDLSLLRGEATERGQLIVELTVPRANPAASDAAAIDQEALPGGGAA